MAMRIVASERISAPTSVVFSVMSDFAGAAGRIRGIRKIEMLTDGPVGKGTRFRETRIVFGEEATETMEVIDFQPGRSYTLGSTSGGSEYRAVMSVRPAGAGSEIEMEFRGRPLTLPAKFMGFLMGWMVRGVCEKMVKQDLADIKAAAEVAADEQRV